MLDELCVFLILTEGRGTGTTNLRLVSADTDQSVWQTPPRNLSFPGDPLQLFGVTFRVSRCRFPEAGLYHLQLCYNGQVLAEQPMLLRSES